MCERLWDGQPLAEIYGDAKNDNIAIFNKGCLGGGKIKPEFFSKLAFRIKERLLSKGVAKSRLLEPQNIRLLERDKWACRITMGAAHGARQHLDQAAYQAARLGHAPLLEFLASRGAILSRYNVLDTMSESPLFLAKKGKIMHDLLHLYLLDPKREDRCGATPLHLVMASDCESSCVQALLDVSPNLVKSVDLDGWNALHCLTLMRYVNAEPFIKKIVLLHRAGSDLNVLTPEGETPMSIFYRRSCSPLSVKKKGLMLMESLGAQPCPEDVGNISDFLHGTSNAKGALIVFNQLGPKELQEGCAMQQQVSQ